MRTIGLALAILGLIALVYGGVSYSQQKTILDVGGIKATVTEHKKMPVAPIAGALALCVGGVLLMNRKRTA